jgi:putative redox protein
MRHHQPRRSIAMTDVIVRSGAGLEQTIETRGHRLVADEPHEQGGADAGPSPYELLLAALGACTAMTLRMYAERKGWPLAAIQVRLRHERIHAEDCAHCETRTGYLDRIQKEILVEGDLTQEQLARLQEIARRCPVNQTLQREIVIEDSLVGSAG